MGSFPFLAPRHNVLQFPCDSCGEEGRRRRDSYGTFIGRGVALTVRTKTRRSLSAVCNLVNNLRPLGLGALTEFLQECRAQGARGKTLNGYRCAVLHVQREHGWSQFAADEGLVRAIKGYVYFDKQHGVPRGGDNRGHAPASMDSRKTSRFRVRGCVLRSLALWSGVAIQGERPDGRT